MKSTDSFKPFFACFALLLFSHVFLKNLVEDYPLRRLATLVKVENVRKVVRSSCLALTSLLPFAENA